MKVVHIVREWHGKMSTGEILDGPTKNKQRNRTYIFFPFAWKKKNKNKGKQVREEREVHKLENLICVPE